MVTLRSSEAVELSVRGSSWASTSDLLASEMLASKAAASGLLKTPAASCSGHCAWPLMNTSVLLTEILPCDNHRQEDIYIQTTPSTQEWHSHLTLYIWMYCS